MMADKRFGKLIDIYNNKFAPEEKKDEAELWAKLYAAMEPGFELMGFREGRQNKFARILVITFDAVGDHILYGALVKELRRLLPKAKITWLTRASLLPLIRYCPYVNEVLAMEDSIINPFSYS